MNESPVIEFYDLVFNKKPKIEALSELRAKGQKYNDGKSRKANFAIYGMTYQPDLANQIHLIKSCNESEMLPASSHPEEAIGLHTVSDLFTIQDTIRKCFLINPLWYKYNRKLPKPLDRSYRAFFQSRYFCVAIEAVLF